jgi:hypothetical protein
MTLSEFAVGFMHQLSIALFIIGWWEGLKWTLQRLGAWRRRTAHLLH